MIEVIKAGTNCSIQDMGRKGYRHLGVPISGVIDEKSAVVANLILGNDPNAALIEVGPIGLKIKFHSPSEIVLTGAPKKVLLNNEIILFNQKHFIRKGDVLSIGSGEKGVWSYLAVKGGILSEKVLNSRSYCHLANIGTGITKGTHLPLMEYKQFGSSTLYSNVRPTTIKEIDNVTVNKGPEYDWLTIVQKEALFSMSYTIGTSSNRMGYYLVPTNQDALKNTLGIITSAVSPGTVQLPPSGVPIVLMKDCQTTGGYARILQVSQGELSALVQKRAGSKLRLLLNDRV